MKKFRLLALSLLSASMFMFTSCEEDEDPTLGPTLTMQELNSGKTSGNITVAPNTTLTFTWDARSGDSNLETFRLSLSGVNVVNPIPTSEQGNDFPYDIRNADNDNYLDTLMIDAGSNNGNTTYSFTVVDRDGNEENVSFTVTVSDPSTQLSSASSFTWERQGSNPGTGLGQFGLEWTSNTSQSAIVTKDAATEMVELAAATWTTISTVEDLDVAITAGTSITQYDGVSVQQSDSYDDVLGVRHNGKVYMIHVTNGDVSTGGGGTTITITGEFRAEP